MSKQVPWFWLALGAAAVLYALTRTTAGQSAVAGVTDYVANLLTPRGIRNNNPGNIRRNAIAWQGALDEATVEGAGQTWDPDFVQFDVPGNGVRAIGHILSSYAARSLSTVQDVISAWSATDQGSYIANVAAALGVAPTDTIDVVGNLPTLATAIIQQENGQQPYAATDISSWVYA